MRGWGWLVAVLYALALLVLSVPTTILAFAPELFGVQNAQIKAMLHFEPMSLKDFDDGGGLLRAATAWPFWAALSVMILCQAALLIVPVRVKSRRPVTHRTLLLPLAACGLMTGLLAFGAAFSVAEFAFGDFKPEAGLKWALPIGLSTWVVWTGVFFRLSLRRKPMDTITRQCRLLIRGSILELLIAVPTHIVARCRDYCCAGLMTFVGLACGISVMLFAFGPGVFFLFADRWRQLHPESGSGERPEPDGRSALSRR